MSWLDWARFGLALAPGLRKALSELVKAFRDGDEQAARRAYEAARRVAFVTRQR
jgi:hypothetical protein